jgi:hypothetical protein
MVYVNEWVKAQEDGTQVAETLFAHTPSWLRGPITRLLGFDLGAQPTPMRRPAGFGALYVRIIYLAVCISALIATTLFVAAALIIVGITLINANETRLLAGSVDVYWSLDGLVFTRQLMSLSLSLGAFASIFLTPVRPDPDPRPPGDAGPKPR